MLIGGSIDMYPIKQVLEKIEEPEVHLYPTDVSL